MSMNEKIQNVFVSEFPEVQFDVFSENGLLNERSVIFTVFADGQLITKKYDILNFAKTVFDEVWLNSEIEDNFELVLLGLLTAVDED